jgi:hypothetical protein
MHFSSVASRLPFTPTKVIRLAPSPQLLPSMAKLPLRSLLHDAELARIPVSRHA